jgi:hypothetical protein
VVGRVAVVRAAALAAVIAITTALAGGCAQSGGPPPGSAPLPMHAPDPTVIDFSGTNGLHWGETLTGMRDAGLMAASSDGCGPRFTDIEGAGPVFENGRLVLIWAYPPLHTPEDVMVGTPLSSVRRAYPQAVTLPLTPGLFAALLVANGLGEAYLILHDGTIVQKLIVGLEAAARRLYASRLDTC